MHCIELMFDGWTYCVGRLCSNIIFHSVCHFPLSELTSRVPPDIVLCVNWFWAVVDI